MDNNETAQLSTSGFWIAYLKILYSILNRNKLVKPLGSVRVIRKTAADTPIDTYDVRRSSRCSVCDNSIAAPIRRNIEVACLKAILH